MRGNKGAKIPSWPPLPSLPSLLHIGEFGGEEKWSITFRREILFYLSSSHIFPPRLSFKPNTLLMSLVCACIVLDWTLLWRLIICALYRELT